MTYKNKTWNFFSIERVCVSTINILRVHELRWSPDRIIEINSFNFNKSDIYFLSFLIEKGRQCCDWRHRWSPDLRRRRYHQGWYWTRICLHNSKENWSRVPSTLCCHGMCWQCPWTLSSHHFCKFPDTFNLQSGWCYNLCWYISKDGGCTCPGDIAKAIGAGADFVMLGGMLAGHDQSGGEVVERSGKKLKLFYGMSSATAMKKHAGGVAEYRASEGKRGWFYRNLHYSWGGFY